MSLQIDPERLNAEIEYLARISDTPYPSITRASAALGLPCRRMISRAYHDSLFMAQVCPTAMIFVRSKDGISHRPDEYSSPGDIANGVRVLAGALDLLAG
ncbi:MAG: M20/M25/M40 family metallo-hydrolase [Lacunisphaera sp.]|nr:M20/M25/M40 family metallo-hydrolase [Lacunisphaera sp.]